MSHGLTIGAWDTAVSHELIRAEVAQVNSGTGGGLHL
jgi:hypothetical protein